MLFHIFNSQEERRKFGGSGFLEIQFCKMKSRTEINELVEVDNVKHWQNDSLYIYLDDIENFIKEYKAIFNNGIYANLKTGIVDVYGINYYKLELIEIIITKILDKKPMDYEILIKWLNRAKSYNGFYILGI